MSGLLPEPWSTLLAPAAKLYGMGVAARNRRFDSGHGVVTLPEPVISVGNITVGGTGKTPVCRHVLSELRRMGRVPALAMRGYRSKANGSSDEAEEYQDHMPDLPLAIGPDRVGAIGDLRGQAPFDCVVLDDGFQHRRISRQLDLVLVDATRTGLDERLLPSGLLREPARALNRADAIVVTRSEGFDQSLADRLEALSGQPPIAWSRHAWQGVDVHRNREPVEQLPPDDLAGWKVAIGLGVGNPRPLREAVVRAGASIVFDLEARDHHRYTADDISRLVGSGADGILVTGKDWVKIRSRPELVGDVPVLVPRLAVDVFSGEEALRDRIRAAVGRS